MDNITIRAFNEDDIPAIRSGLYEWFYSREPIAYALDLKAPDDVIYETNMFLSLITKEKQNPVCFGAFNEDNICVALNINSIEDSEVDSGAIYDYETDGNVKAEMLKRVCKELLKEKNLFTLLKASKFLFMHTLATDPAYAKRGLATKLIRHAIAAAEKLDINAFATVATSKYSNSIFKALGFKEIQICAYDTFELDGKKVLSRSADVHKYMSLMCKSRDNS